MVGVLVMGVMVSMIRTMKRSMMMMKMMMMVVMVMKISIGGSVGFCDDDRLEPKRLPTPLVDGGISETNSFRSGLYAVQPQPVQRLQRPS